MAIKRSKLLKPKATGLTPKELRSNLLKKEAKDSRAELETLRKKLELQRQKALRKEKAARKIENLFDEKINSTSNILTEDELNEGIPSQIREDMLAEDANIVFKPNPGPQTDFLAATETEVLYGGARGGGR